MSYTYAEAYEFASIGTARTIEDIRKILILNIAQNLIWQSYDWRWTIGNLYPFWLVPYEQDFGSPIVAVPDDLERLQRANIIHLNPGGPIPTRNKLEVERELDLTDVLGIPRQISLIRASRSLRLWPRCPGGVCAPLYMIESSYKKLPTIVGSDYQTVNIPSQDHQIGMWIDAITYAYYKITKDPKSGEVRTNSNGQVFFTGALAAAMAAIKTEAMNEGLDQGDPQIAPSEGLLINYSPSLYGYGPFL